MQKEIIIYQEIGSNMGDFTRKMIRGFFWYLLVVSFILYVTYYDSLQGVLGLVKDISLPLIFVFGSILVVDKYQTIIRQKRIKGEVDEVIYITYMDAMKNDLLAFATAAAILMIALFLSENGIGVVDILQAAIAFSAIYYVRVYYFNKIGK